MFYYLIQLEKKLVNLSTSYPHADDLDSMGGLYLIIKKYIEIHKGMEFRCFIRNKSLVAIC